MLTVYKFTDKDCYTRRGMSGETRWEVGKPSSQLSGNILCAPGVWHAYESSLVAEFMDSFHGDFGPTGRLWKAETDYIVVREGGLKCGVHQLTLLEELSPVVLSTNVRIRDAIICSLLVYTNKDYITWANDWLNKIDRTKNKAYDAYVAAHTISAASASSATISAISAISAAYAATYAANATDVDLHTIIENAIQEEALLNMRK